MNLFAFYLQNGLGGTIAPFIPMILIFVVFYFLVITPQKKRQRELQEIVSNLKAGDRVVTSGGIIGTITAVRDTSLLIRSADKSMLEITRSAVVGLQTEEKPS
jgi:preprotein translocase subunit YajC